MLSLSVIATPSAVLKLSGESTGISFGNPGTNAILSASCASKTAAVRDMHPITFQTIPAEGTVTVRLLNVPPTCVDVPVREPCVDDEEHGHPHFFCVFSGAVSTAVVGPVMASKQERWAGQQLLAVQPLLACPLPPYEQILSSTGYTGDGSSVSLVLTISHYASSGEDAVDIPFEGPDGGNTLTLAMGAPSMPPSPLPPPPPPPPRPPPSPPPSPRYEAIVSHGGWSFYKLPMTGYATNINIYETCQAAGLVAPCPGDSGCSYSSSAPSGNGGTYYCTLTSEVGCGSPMGTGANALCGNSPPGCPVYSDTFIWMGGNWGSSSGCGVVNGGWCATGNINLNKFAYCASKN